MSDNPLCVDLFAGAGGFSLGFEQGGIDVIAAVDRNESAMKTYEHNFDDVQPFTLDVRDFDAEDIDKETDFSAEDVSVVIGGPPCKGFSTAGRMNPEDPRNELAVQYARTVGDLDPEVVVMENVTGILGMKDGKYINEITKTLSDEGYTVREPEILTTADYGVPQLRKRVILIATKGSMMDLPAPSHRSKNSQERLDTDRDLNYYVSVEEAIGDLSFLNYGEEADKYKLWARTDYQQEMRDGSNQIHNHKAPNHGETVRERFNQFGHGETMDDIDEEYQTKKHTMIRWDPEEPSPTVTTLPEDFIHYERPRIPTVRELARIQSFPDWFEFKGPRTTGGPRRRNEVPQYTQVGNAVPPKFAAAIAESVKEYLNSEGVKRHQAAGT